MKEALHYERRDDGRVQCRLCPQQCVIADGRTGICRVRKCIGGILYAMTYAECTSVAMDPIEKKPLYHFHPGHDILSLGSWGCNFACSFCQNWHISFEQPPTQTLPPEAAVAQAQRAGAIGIAYTYNEPMIWYEYVLETARRAHAEGLKNVLVTNGFISPEPLDELLPVIDALNIDLKSIRPEFYRKLCHGELGPVLETAESANNTAHVEVTNLIIPGWNDTEEELAELATWIAEHLGPETPTHLSAYSPRHQLQAPPTSAELLLKAHEIFRTRLGYVYLGNVTTAEGNDTACHSCGQPLVTRRGYAVSIVGLKGSACANCGAESTIVA